VPVILNPENNLPGGFDQIGATLENAARLHKAGVLIAIGMDTHNIRLAPQHTGNAVANGLPHAAGIAALTLNIAKIFGLDDTLGSLEPGKEASLVIWSGDPLEVTEAAEQVFIKGEPMPMTSRQIQLKDRYMNRDVSKPVGYTR
jgi:imidazolonepropionase-like amidohydrolase